jgi:hypothetical protein
MCTVILPPGGYPIAVKKYSISYQKLHSPLLRLRHSFLSFFKGAFLRILNDRLVRASDRGSSPARRHPQHCKYISTDFLSWFNILRLGTKDVITGRRKVGAFLYVKCFSMRYLHPYVSHGSEINYNFA